jgi:hypothetical protein
MLFFLGGNGTTEFGGDASPTELQRSVNKRQSDEEQKERLDGDHFDSRGVCDCEHKVGQRCLEDSGKM